MRLEIPSQHEFDLLVHPAPCRLTGNHAAQHALGSWQPGPGTFCQALYMLQELRSMGQQGSTRAMIFIHGPLQTGVANVYGQKCHAADYQHFSL